jgi:CheY-like chemotaxis protein
MSPTEDDARRPRLLLIDDDAISREVLSILLEMHGYPIVCAEDGVQALDRIETESPEVILMDTQMPGLSGVDLIEALRARTRAKIVAISGSEVGEAIRQASDGFLLKPIQPEDLDALLAADPRKPEASDPVSLAAAADEPVIDPRVLGKLQAMMPPAAVREIYTAVAADLKTRLIALAAAMNAGDADEVARIAHTTKGGCSMVGLTAATQAASHLECSNRNGTWAKELAQLHSALAALERILTDEFQI